MRVSCLEMSMGTELIFAGFFCILSVFNSIGTIAIWLRYLRESRDVITRIKVTKLGEVKVSGLPGGHDGF